MIAGTARRDHVHPVVDPVLRKRNNVLTGQVLLMEMVTTVSADVAVTGEELAIGQARFEIEGIDVGHTARANNAVDRDDGLLTGDGVVPAMKHGNFPT